MAKMECKKDFSSTERTDTINVTLDIYKTSGDMYVASVDVEKEDDRYFRCIIRCDEDTTNYIDACLEDAMESFIKDICAAFTQFAY